MAIDGESRTSRRSLLAAALGGLGGLVVSRLGRPDAVAALDGAPALLGTANTSTTETSFENTDTGEASLKGLHADGIGVSGESATGTAVRGASTDDTSSDFLAQSYRSGVIGTAGDLGVAGDIGGVALNTDEVGAYGFSDVSPASVGVWGDTWGGVGVQGTGDLAVAGFGDSVGLYGAATSPAAYALLTDGKIKFNGRSGRTTISPNHLYRDVSISGMTSSSVVIATLQTRKAGYHVECVVSYTGKFRIFINKTSTGTIYFSYLVIG